MRNETKSRRGAAAWITVLAVLSSLFMPFGSINSSNPVSGTAAAAASVSPASTPTATSSAAPLTSDSAIEFEGFSLKYCKDDGSIQALVDIYLQDYDAHGIGYMLQYNPAYLRPSYYEDNAASGHKANNLITDSDDAILSFKQNPEAFPIKYKADGTVEYDYLDSEFSYSGIDFTNNILTHTLILNRETPESLSTKIGYPETEYQGGTIYIPRISILAKGKQKVKLGTLSFRVMVPYDFAGLGTSSTLQSVLSVYNDGESDQAYAIYVKPTGPDTHDEDFAGHFPINWKVNKTLDSIQLAVPKSTVTAYSLYDRCQSMGGGTAGTLDDLFAYLNQTSSNIIKIYTDATSEIEAFSWDKTKATVKIKDTSTTVTDGNGTYNPKGGLTYIIEQGYSTTGKTVEAEVTVTPSTITGFKYSPKVKNFSESQKGSITWSMLLLPKPIIPILTGVDDTYIPPEDRPENKATPSNEWQEADNDWTPNNVTDLNDTTKPVPSTVPYTRTFPKSLLYLPGQTDLPPWLTEPAGFNWDVTVKRNIVPDSYPSPAPTGTGGDPTVTAEVDRETGALLIKVTKEAFGTISAGDKFTVYLSDGRPISTDDALVTVDTTSADVPTGGCIVKVYMYDDTVTSPTAENFTDADRDKYQSIINLGNEDFTISRTPSGSVESDEIGFKFDPRVNYYLWENLDVGSTYEKYVEKDYSAGKTSMFPVYAGQDISQIAKYIVFPDNSTIPVAYNGLTGDQPDSYTYPNSTDTLKIKTLAMAKVDSWEIEGQPGVTTLPTQGTDVTIVGKLSTYTYSNFGTVTNGNTCAVHASGGAEDVYLKIKLTTLGNANPSPSPSTGPSPQPSGSPGTSPTPSGSPGTTPTPPPGTTPTPAPTLTPGESLRVLTVTNGGTYINGSPTGGAEVELTPTTIFEYDKKKKGYPTFQNQKYRIENNGTENISGLTLQVTDLTREEWDGSTPPSLVPKTPIPTSFIIGYNNIYKITPAGVITPNVTTLNSGESLFFDIRNALQLPVGVYTAKVYVGSSHNSQLGEFTISFEVTEKDVYQVVVDNSYPTIGMGYLKHDIDGITRICSNTYEEGETVYLHADIIDTGYMFDVWDDKTTTQDLTFADNTKKDTTFVMVVPGSYRNPASGTDTVITVEPTFAESYDVWIRLTDLIDYNPDNTTNALRNPLPPYSPRPTPAFSEQQLDYRTIVDGTITENYVTFDVKQDLLDPATTPAPMTVTVTLDGNPVTATSLGANSGNPVGTAPNIQQTTQFKTDSFPLKEGANVLKIKTSYTDTKGTTYSKEYTLTIYRKKGVDVTLNSGNSPYGLIESSFTTPAEIAAAKAHFDIDNTFKKQDASNQYVYYVDPALTPSKAVTTYETHYFDGAWDKKNYDKDPSALFVYNGEAFSDPGFKDLKDMDGNAVTATSVKRKIEKLNVVTGTINSIDDLCDPANITQQDVTISATGESVNITELQGLTIRPGVYTMKYTFTDSDGSDSSFTRPVIVLAKKGDMNLGLASWTTTNPDIIYQRLNNNLYKDVITSNDEWKRIYAYRVGDVTEDENVNSIDANAVLNNTTIKNRQYYEKLPVQPTDPWPTINPSPLPVPAEETPVPMTTPKPILTLDYLGKGFNPESKPMEPNLTQNDVYDSTQPISGPGIVWVGIGIKNVENLEYFMDGLYSVDFAIDYDPDIFEPCDRRKLTDGETITSPATFTGDIADTIETYNIDNSAQIQLSDVTLWKNAQLYKPSLQFALDLNPTPTPAAGATPAPSAAPTPTPLPSTTAAPSASASPAPASAPKAYKTEFVTIKSVDGTSLRMSGINTPPASQTMITDYGLNMPDADRIYLLRVPFRLKQYPPDGYTGKAITINLTEQTFVMGATSNGVTNSASWEGQSKDKTTAVNNAYNHFDSVEIADLFKTDGKYYVSGTVRGWNPNMATSPFTISLFRHENETDTADYTFTSNYAEYGEVHSTYEGEVEWNFKIPVSNQFDYLMKISKNSHLDYPAIQLLRASPAPTASPAPSASPEPSLKTVVLSGDDFEVNDPVELIVGDIDDDGYIKDPDREELIRYFNQQKPWFYRLDKFNLADLNGDNAVNMFDLMLWQTHIHKGYPEGGGGTG